jgi:outer membrane protein assembly factor BamE (lipoprotein component of BamABCDE complex)
MKFKRMLGAFTFTLLSCLMLPSQTVASKNVTLDMVSKIKVGSSNRAQVLELLRTPWRSVDYGDCNPVDYQEIWEYLGQDAAGVFRISIEFDEAGIARIITKTSAKGPVIVLAAAPARGTTHEH